MEHKRNPEGPEDVVMENSYPSPNADEANYYATTAQRSQDIETGHGTTHVNPDDSDPSQHELQQLQREIQDESSSHHETPVDLAELQLAAQLTQGLAAQHQARQVLEVNEASSGGAASDLQASHEAHAAPEHGDQPLHVHDGLPGVPGQLPNHDPSQDHDLQEQIQAQLQNQQQNELQGAMGHPIPQQQHHQYLPHTPHPSGLSNLNMHALASGGYGTSPDGIPPRKRSKVSRACDECRRKKIKCDAVSETGDQSCSNCRRSSVTCLFSRIPQKRGPSKGYIKELADRIFTIEGRLGGGAETSADTPRRQSSETFPSPAPGDKRPFSSISSDALVSTTSTKPLGWSEPRPIQPYQAPTSRPPMNVNDLTPSAIVPANVEAASRPAGLGDGPSDATPGPPVGEIDDDSFQLYLTAIHPVFPVLATTKARVESILSQCPSALRDACLEAFQEMIQPFQSPTDDTKSKPRAAVRLLAEWEAVDPPLDRVTDLVSLQVLLMLAIRDSLASPAVQSQHGAASRKSALSRAISLGFSMKMYAALPDPVPEPEFDANSDENVALRAWWTVFLLDRWDAIGTGSFMLIPEESTNLVPGLKPVLGTAGYKLIQLSEFFLTFKELMASSTDLDVTSRRTKAYKRLASIIFQHFNEQLPPDATESTHPFHYLVYWHARIVSYLCSPEPNSKGLLEVCKGSVGLLVRAGGANVATPLNHHFAALTSMALLELSTVENAREEALELLKHIADNTMPRSPYDGSVKDKILDRLRPTTTGSLNSQNLQQLADLATAADGTKEAADSADSADTTEAEAAPKAGGGSLPTSYEGLGFDPRPLLQAGYLNYFNFNPNDE
ncbi:hypothetical protein GQ53DRAFT_385721 [Thozetella sp. PMI_491]|nr:hypothetical protein GQ53DRAFT_385721 [Thozetella sp. PMI_491]